MRGMINPPKKPRVSDRKWKYSPDFGVQKHYRYFLRNQRLFKKLGTPTRKEIQELVPYSLFSKITKEYYLEIQRRILDGEQVKIPYLGNIQVLKFKIDFSRKTSTGKPKLSVNWAETKRIGKYVYFLNEDRGYYIYKIKWKRNNNITGIKPYIFVPERYFKRKLAKILKEHPEKDYKEFIKPRKLNEHSS